MRISGHEFLTLNSKVIPPLQAKVQVSQWSSQYLNLNLIEIVQRGFKLAAHV